MKKSKFTEEPIALALRQADTGARVPEVCRTMGISQVDYYDNYDVWQNAILLTPGGDVLIQETTAVEMADTDSIDLPPTNALLLTAPFVFPGASTGLPLDFTLDTYCGNATFNDDEFESAYYPCLSPGDVDDCKNDDFEITVTAVEPGHMLFAMGT